MSFEEKIVSRLFFFLREKMTGKCEYDGQVGQGHERMKRTAVGRWGRGGRSDTG